MWWKSTTNNAVSAARGFIDTDKYWLLLLAALFLIMVIGAPAQAQVLPQTSVPINGEIQSITLTNPADIYSGGRMEVAGYSVILPKNLLIDLPANRLSLQQIFKQAPLGCIAAGQSGLAKTDTCNATGTGGFATITAVRTAAGDVIAGDVFIQKGVELVSGTVTYISYTDGYFLMNGIAGDPATGVMVRLNDPISRHTVQQGAGCAGGPNCSPDPRFTLDPDNYTNTFSTGYPICIPSTVPRSFPGLPALTGIPAVAAGTTQSDASGNGDLLCPSFNRSAAAYETAADSRRFAPIKIGDPITAEGNFEIIGGVRFLSTHTISVKKSMWTKNLAGQPDYVFLEEVFIEAPAFQNQRMRAMWIGFTTMEPTAPRPTDVDIWSIHRDPLNNEIHEFPLASVRGCDLASGAGTCSSMGLIGAGANIFRIRYDVDYILAALQGSGGADAKLSPCAHLIANPRWTALNLCSGGDTLANNFGILQPEPHEIIARTGHKLDNPDGSLIALDINGLDAQNGEYLFPLGMNLGGIETAEMNEIDLNQMASPVVFEGIPWNLDRRLGPSGCLDNLGNQVACPAGAMGTFALDPFPYSGLDPRTQADFTANIPGLGAATGGTPKGAYSVPAFTNTPLSNASNRVRSYLAQITPGVFNFDGDNTILPFPTASPASQGVIAPIVTVPVQCVAGGFAPVAQNDTAVTNAGVAVTIPVLSNDITPVGVMNFASVTIVSSPSGTAVANLDGTVTFTPAGAGTATFTYTVAELTFGGVSNVATVTVTVIGAPVAVGDSAVTNKDVPVLIPVLANDSSPSGILLPGSVIATQGTSGTTAVNAANGTITYTPQPGFFGNDTFTYTVKDNAVLQQTSNSATVSVTVNNVATPPLALNDAVATGPSTTVTISILANDQAFGAGNALDTTSVVATGLTPTTSGTLVSGGTPTVSFTPAPDFFGTASFTYTVKDTPTGLTSNIATVTIVVSSPPAAVADAATTLEDTAVTIDLTANDTDPDLNMLPATVAITTQPGSGSVASLGNGSVTYTPALNANGVITFAYTVSDALGGVSLPATVTVTVTAVNDAPTAGALNLTIAEDNALPVVLAGADPDTGDILTYTVTSSLLNGTLTGIAPNMTYTPNLNYSGPAFFTYTVSDGSLTSAPATVAITVTAVNDPPVTVNDAAGTTVNTARAISVLANDTDVDGTIAPSTVTVTQAANGTVTVNTVTGVVTYTPSLNFTGVNTFTYTVADNLGAVSASATVTVNVAGATGTVAVAQAQFRTVTPNVSGDWRIEGTGTPGAVVTIYTGGTIPGPVVGTITIAADGRWKFQAAGSTVLPGPTNSISVQTNGGATRLAFPVAVR